MEHSHYVGATQELGKTDFLDQWAGKSGHFMKCFLISDRVNLNKWVATWEAIQRDVYGFIGRPVVLTEDVDHPDVDQQDQHKVGEIIDIHVHPAEHIAYAIANIKDESVWQKLKKGFYRYMSPAVTAKNSDAEKKGEIDELKRFTPQHHAIVARPAYGVISATVDGFCDGTGDRCKKSLTFAASLLAATAEPMMIPDETVQGASDIAYEATCLAMDWFGRHPKAKDKSLTAGDDADDRRTGASETVLRQGHETDAQGQGIFQGGDAATQWQTGVAAFQDGEIVHTAGAFQPNPGEKPDKDGYYWRTVGGFRIRIKAGEDFGKAFDRSKAEFDKKFPIPKGITPERWRGFSDSTREWLMAKANAKESPEEKKEVFEDAEKALEPVKPPKPEYDENGFNIGGGVKVTIGGSKYSTPEKIEALKKAWNAMPYWKRRHVKYLDLSYSGNAYYSSGGHVHISYGFPPEDMKAVLEHECAHSRYEHWPPEIREKWEKAVSKLPGITDYSGTYASQVDSWREDGETFVKDIESITKRAQADKPGWRIAALAWRKTLKKWHLNEDDIQSGKLLEYGKEHLTGVNNIYANEQHSAFMEVHANAVQSNHEPNMPAYKRAKGIFERLEIEAYDMGKNLKASLADLWHDITSLTLLGAKDDKKGKGKWRRIRGHNVFLPEGREDEALKKHVKTLQSKSPRKKKLDKAEKKLDEIEGKTQEDLSKWHSKRGRDFSKEEARAIPKETQRQIIRQADPKTFRSILLALVRNDYGSFANLPSVRSKMDAAVGGKEMRERTREDFDKMEEVYEKEYRAEAEKREEGKKMLEELEHLIQFRDMYNEEMDHRLKNGNIYRMTDIDEIKSILKTGKFTNTKEGKGVGMYYGNRELDGTYTKSFTVAPSHGFKDMAGAVIKLPGKSLPFEKVKQRLDMRIGGGIIQGTVGFGAWEYEARLGGEPDVPKETELNIVEDMMSKAAIKELSKKFKVNVMPYTELLKVSGEQQNIARGILERVPAPETKEQVIAHLRSWFSVDAEQEFAKAEQTGLIKKAGKNREGEDVWVPA